MRVTGTLADLWELAETSGLKKYKKAAAVTLALFACLIAISMLNVYIQPANAASLRSAAVIDAQYGDEKAYYCTRYSLQGSSVAAICQAPEMVAGSYVPNRQFTVATNSTGSSITGCGAYDAIFKLYNWDISTAEAICQAESGGNPKSVSSTNDFGLMQLHNMEIFDPYKNIAAAYNKYQIQGWYAWTTYNTGAYLRFERI